MTTLYHYQIIWRMANNPAISHMQQEVCPEFCSAIIFIFAWEPFFERTIFSFSNYFPYILPTIKRWKTIKNLASWSTTVKFPPEVLLETHHSLLTEVEQNKTRANSGKMGALFFIQKYY